AWSPSRRWSICSRTSRSQRGYVAAPPATFWRWALSSATMPTWKPAWPLSKRGWLEYWPPRTPPRTGQPNDDPPLKPKGQAMHARRLRRLESLVEMLEGRLKLGQQSLPPRRVQTPQDVIDLLQEQVEAVRQESMAGTIEKARAVGYLAGLARKAIETG